MEEILLPELDDTPHKAAHDGQGLTPWRCVRSQDAGVARDIVSAEITRHTLRLADPRARFDFRYSEAKFSTTTLSDFAYLGTASEVLLPSEERDCYLLIIPIGGHTIAMYDGVGTKLEPGNAMVFGPNGNLAFRNSTDWRNLDVRISKGPLETYAAAQDGAPGRRPIEFDKHPVNLMEEAQGLRRFVRFLLGETRASRSLLRDRPTAERLEEALYSIVMDCVPNDCGERRRPDGVECVPKIVRLAEGFMMARARESLNVETIAAAAGVRPRSLHKAFREHRGYTPLAFLREHRLRLAHGRLSAAEPGQTTVTEVAVDCGFTHLGKFACAYKARYGESPSETLRY